ncbi:MAG: glycosyltransferase family 2 protein [Patescibacteria group bacterium]|nr:glycosyltransferase family 2 protein [Patescibacteria group bacterium]
MKWHLSDRQKYRFYEMFPGIIVWVILLGSILLSFIRPIWVIYFIIIFDLYWLIKVLYLSILLIYAWRKYRKNLKINWREKAEKLPGYADIYHLVFFATYKEEIDVVGPTFDALIKSDYPLDKLIVVLAGEEKDKDNFLKMAEEIKNRYADKFFKFLVTVHPKNLPDEISGKGSNLHFSGQEAQKMINELGLPYEKIIVSSFDVDTCVHPLYLPYLTYVYLTHPDPTHCSYQPVAVFNNNIWDSPALTRVVARGTTFWLLTELTKPHIYFTFSSHALSFKALTDIGFWQKDVVSEDSRIFLQCYNHYNGDYQTVPLYMSVSMDTVYVGSIKKTLINQYKQILRWGYGVENVPWMIWNLFRNKKMPFKKKIPPFWVQLEGSCTWATVPLLIFILGNLPMRIAHLQNKTEAIVHNAPFVLEKLMTFTLVGLFLSAILSTILLPPKPQKHKITQYFFMIFQWLLFPITMILFGSVPAGEGITRLMLGKYIGFRVTEKKRKVIK